MVRLILTDIDETIMPKGDTQVPAHVIEAFHAAQDAGIVVATASLEGKRERLLRHRPRPRLGAWLLWR